MALQAFLCEAFEVNNKDSLIEKISNINNFSEFITAIQTTVIDKYRHTNSDTQKLSWHYDSYTLRSSWSLLFYSRIVSEIPKVPLLVSNPECKYGIVPVLFYMTPTSISDANLIC